MKVHTQQGCAPCVTLKYFLNQMGVAYTEIVGGARIYPTVKFKGQVVEGYNLQAIKQLLKT